jgi:hypothetical protein
MDLQLILFYVFISLNSDIGMGLYQEYVVNVFFKKNEFSVVHLQRKSTEIEFLSYIGGTLGKNKSCESFEASDFHFRSFRWFLISDFSRAVFLFRFPTDCKACQAIEGVTD